MNYYEVEAKCGHVGRNNYILKKFYVYADSGSDAATIVRYLPRVKHHHKDTIRKVIEITYEEYIEGLNSKYDDMYFQVSNSTEQREKCLFEIGTILKEEGKAIYKKPTHIKRALLNNMFVKDWKARRSYVYE